jgi:3',5'-cyclic AMP phosphodiesterase CpdA
MAWKRFCIAAVLLGVLGVVPTVSSAESIRFIVVGDTQAEYLGSTNKVVLSKIVRQAMSLEPATQFAVFTGDLIEGDDTDAVPADLQTWRQIVDPFYQANFFGAKVYVTPGNHDMRGEAYKTNWQNAFPEMPDNGPENEKKLTYSFDVGPCHLVVLNTDTPGDRRHMVDLDWLEADLVATTQPIKLVFGHEPAFPIGIHVGESLDVYPEQRDRFWAILGQYGVKAYFCGHEHIYDRWIKDGVQQIITGSGGGSSTFFNFLILDADENDVTISVHSVSSDRTSERYKLSDTANVADEDRTGDDFYKGMFSGLPCAGMIGLPFTMLWLGLRWTVREDNE